MKKKFYRHMLMIMSVAMSCSSTSKNAVSEMSPSEIWQKTAQELIGTMATCVPNTTKTMALCQGEEDSVGLPMIVSFIVLATDGTPVLPLQKVHGEISWHDDATLRKIQWPRVINKFDTSSQIKTTYIPIENKILE